MLSLIHLHGLDPTIGGMRTIATVMDEKPGNASGFDCLRIALAISVMVWHSPANSYGPDGEYLVRGGLIGWPLTLCILPSFFALSGFLVAGSLARNTLPGFLTLRALRIVPALAVEVTLSALMIGPLVTTLPLWHYFSDREFIHYFLNIGGDIHYFLPGVFNDLPLPQYVNLQLWTVPWELTCYIAIVVAATLGIIRRPSRLLKKW